MSIHEGERPLAPCEWAARQLELRDRPTSKPEPSRLRIPFLLVAAQYQHALFGRWPRVSAHRIRNYLKELKLDSDPTLLGLHYFLSAARTASIPATLESQLSGLCDALDPAGADPEVTIQVSTRFTLSLRDVDVRFSQSVGEGLHLVRRYISPLEVDLLTRLEKADDRLSEPDVRRRRSAVAKRVQTLVRDFSGRLVRRSLGVRWGIVREYSILQDFGKVIDGDQELLHDAVKEVESLLNTRDRFIVTLNTTFGEALPPEQRRAVLSTGKQKVKARGHSLSDSPAAAMRFLQVGSGATSEPIPLTYELYRSLRELKLGMLPASLPRTVVALLDTTRARLSGRVVRDEDALDEAEIRLGTFGEVIAMELGKFVVRREVLK